MVAYGIFKTWEFTSIEISDKVTNNHSNNKCIQVSNMIMARKDQSIIKSKKQLIFYKTKSKYKKFHPLQKLYQMKIRKSIMFRLWNEEVENTWNTVSRSVIRSGDSWKEVTWIPAKQHVGLVRGVISRKTLRRSS